MTRTFFVLAIISCPCWRFIAVLLFARVPGKLLDYAPQCFQGGAVFAIGRRTWHINDS